ncbi:hypothetical protein [Pseudovibrio denitrificans]|uniref:hypothetical protein n=1 Tax=Pseudovibrio denitrificans TaxID=258256 RepID=UPI0013E32745|nr:hypothetical protein [Pseudovibrio denitrificans]
MPRTTLQYMQKRSDFHINRRNLLWPLGFPEDVAASSAANVCCFAFRLGFFAGRLAAVFCVCRGLCGAGFLFGAEGACGEGRGRGDACLFVAATLFGRRM